MRPAGATAVAVVLLPALLCGHLAMAQAAVLSESEQRTERKAQKSAGGERSPFDIELDAGIEWDSNVSVSELDENTGEGDYAAVFDADVNYELALDKNSSLQLGYGLSQTSYDQFSDFDLQNHLLTADVSRRVGDVDAALAYRFIHARLGGHDYLTTQQASPNLSRFFGKTIFVRAEYTFSDKDFADIGERDATVNAGGADLYWFVKGVRTYVVLGYRYRYENADAAQYDYGANSLKLRLSQRFRFMERDATLKLGWLHEQRDYSARTPSIGENRDDDRNRFMAELELPFSERFFALLAYEYGDFSSNLPAADYEQSIASIKVGLKL